MDITAKFMLGRTIFFFNNLDFIVSTVKVTVIWVFTYVFVNYISHF